MLVNGINIAYDDVGEGDNVLVLVHGHPFNRTMWQPQMEHFNRPRTRSGPRPRLEGVDSSDDVVETERERETNPIVVPQELSRTRTTSTRTKEGP